MFRDETTVSRSTIIFLTGPTAVGKTDLAVSLVDEFDLGLISVDASQVYRGLNIGTAKPIPEVLKKYPHALIDIRDPNEVFSAGAFCQESIQEVHRIESKKQIPTFVGGTMFYFAALTNGLDRLPNADPQLRDKIGTEAQLLGWAALHEQLVLLDPVAGRRIHHNDRQRIQRALEIQDQIRRPFISNTREQTHLPRHTRIIRLGLAFSDRSTLHRRIEQRIDQMLKSGFLDEVRDLLARGIDPQLPSLRSIGYRQAYQYLNNRLDYSNMRESIIFATRQFAKRQLTWMRNTPGTVWFDTADRKISQSVGNYLKTALGGRD
jgi:tRNA dimethylallyltransferase